jgi:hypothetical protein
MVKARAAPAVELLEDVMRTPRPASLEALSWWHPFALYHFLEGPPSSFAQGDHPGKVLSGTKKGPSLQWEGRKASPPCGKGSLQAKSYPLDGRNKHTREGSGPVPKDKSSKHVASRSHGEISCHLSRTHMEDARWKSIVADLQKVSLPQQAR